MNNVISQAEVLTFDIPDDVLEQTASAEHTVFTLFYCTGTANCPAERSLAEQSLSLRSFRPSPLVYT